MIDQIFWGQKTFAAYRTYLSRTVSSTATNTGNSSDGATSTPGLSASLVTSLLAHGISLPFVFCDALCKQTSKIKELEIGHKDVLCTCWTTSSLMGAVKTAGSGREARASGVNKPND